MIKLPRIFSTPDVAHLMPLMIHEKVDKKRALDL
jgi:hypothetical protein